MVEARSVDIVMIDLVRVGGITQWLKVAGMAEAFNLPVVSHLIPEVHVHLIGAIPNGLTVEYMPWLMPLFEEVPQQQRRAGDADRTRPRPQIRPGDDRPLSACAGCSGGRADEESPGFETGIVALPNDEPLAGFSENPNAQEPDRRAAAAHR